MENPFEVIARRLSTIEDLLLDLKHQPKIPTPLGQNSIIDFTSLMEEYYPGIPVSTVRQDTAGLPRTKIGKRVLFDRSDIEEHLRKKRKGAFNEIEQNVNAQFTNQHQRRGGRRTA